MSTITEQFRDQVEAYLATSGMDATSFGRAALNDPRFVFDLRKGRAPSIKTVDRVIEWMRENAGEAAA